MICYPFLVLFFYYPFLSEGVDPKHTSRSDWTEFPSEDPPDLYAEDPMNNYVYFPFLSEGVYPNTLPEVSELNSPRKILLLIKAYPFFTLKIQWTCFTFRFWSKEFVPNTLPEVTELNSPPKILLLIKAYPIFTLEIQWVHIIISYMLSLSVSERRSWSQHTSRSDWTEFSSKDPSVD